MSTLVIAPLTVALCLLVVPAPASAESLCTDTWVGPGEGEWKTAANWSAGHVPTSTDVVCVGAGNVVRSNESADQAGVLQGEGSVVLETRASLEISNALEPSVLGSLTLAFESTLTGAATLELSKSLVLNSNGRMSGSGRTVLLAGASGANTNHGALLLEERNFVNEGTLTMSEGGNLEMRHGAVFENHGTYVDNAGFISEETSAPSRFVNFGALDRTEKTAGEGRVTASFVNHGSVSVEVGVLSFSNSTVEPSSSWSATFEQGNIAFTGGTLVFNETNLLAGDISIIGALVTVEHVKTSHVALGVGEGTLTVASGTTLAVSRLALQATSRSTPLFATITGGGTLTVSESLNETEGRMTGSGSTVLQPGSSSVITGDAEVAERTLDSEGTLTLEPGFMGLTKGALLVNSGTLDANSPVIGFSEEPGEKIPPLIVNTGTFQRVVGIETTPVNVPFENFGSIREVTGHFHFILPIEVERSVLWGGEENPSAPEENQATCGEDVGCSTGNLSKTETDLQVAGRGVGLDLTRTYNSQSAAAGTKGIFGYGWSNSFGDRLVLEKASKRATLTQADGSSVPFSESGGESFTPPSWSQDTLSGSESSGYTLTLEIQTVYRFSGAGRLESVTDRNGNATTLAYNSSGNLEKITDPAGRAIKLAYNAEGLVESAEDPMKHVVKYTYEGGNLASVTQPGESALRWQFKYDGSHELTELTDGRANKTTFEYNSSHQITSETDPMKRNTTFEYEAFKTKTTNHATGAVTVNWSTSAGQSSAVTHGYGTALATTESFTYDSANDLLTSTDGNGHTTKYTYDGHANRTSMVDADNHETKWTYDSTHDVETETKPSGEKTTYQRDGHGNPEVIERPAPGGKIQATRYKYTTSGQVESMTDPLERTWKYEYDNAGDRTAETDPEGDKRTWGYNEDSQETSMVSPRGHVKAGEEAKYKTSTERDAQGRPIKIADPLKHETKYKYDGDGNLESKTDPELNVTTYTYDADDERTKTEEPNKTITETGYDGAGQVTSQTDGRKHTTKYERNVLEQVTEVVDPLGRKALEEYDLAGDLVKKTDSLKRETKYKYDPANRLEEISYSDGKTHAVEYEYNADGLRTKMVDGSGTTSYEYDQLDRLTGTKDGHGDMGGYEYDLANEQTKITYPNGKAVTRTYDKAGRLEKVTDWLGHSTSFNYDADSNVTATIFPTGTSNEDSYAYDDTDAMKEVKMAKGSETRASLVYVRNKNGEVTKATTKGLPGAEAPTFGYDKNSRITKGAGVEYKYDEANDPTTSGTATYAYDAANELEKKTVSKATAATYTYDEVGERTKTAPSTGPATSYGYDQAGDLTTVTRPNEGETSVIEDTYGYNGDGLRVSRTASGSTSYFVWSLAESVPLLLSDGTNSFVYGLGGLPVERINGKEEPLYLHHDQQGSTRMLTNATGENVGSVTYDAYGNVLERKGTATSALGYDGQYTDSDTGLIYLRARYYDPATGQFVTVDPRTKETQEVYAYAANNPLALGDPSGRRPLGCHNVNTPCGRQELRLNSRSHKNTELQEAFATLLRYFNIPTPARGVGYELEPVRNRNGITIREPGTTGEANTIRIMFGDAANPNGSAVIYSEYGKPIDYRTGGSPATRADWHIPGGNKEPIQGLPAWWRGE